MKAPKERYVWGTAILLLIVFVAIAGSGVLETKFTSGSLDESLETSVDGVKVTVAGESLDGEGFQVAVRLNNGGRQAISPGTWTGTRVEDEQGRGYTLELATADAEPLAPGARREVRLLFPAAAADRFPVVLEFPEGAVCAEHPHTNIIRFILQGRDIQRQRAWTHRPASSPAPDPSAAATERGRRGP
jgi:hypothetical protein